MCTLVSSPNSCICFQTRVLWIYAYTYQLTTYLGDYLFMSCWFHNTCVHDLFTNLTMVYFHFNAILIAIPKLTYHFSPYYIVLPFWWEKKRRSIHMTGRDLHLKSTNVSLFMTYANHKCYNVCLVRRKRICCRLLKLCSKEHHILNLYSLLFLQTNQ